MTLLSALRVRYKVFVSVVAFFLLLVAAAAIYSAGTVTSTTQLLVSPNATAGQSSAQSDAFAQQRALAYAEILRGNTVAQRAVNALRLNSSAGDLASRVAVAVVPSTSLIDLSVRDSDPLEAQQLATSLAAEFITMIAGVESSPGQTGGALTVTVVSAAEPGTSVALSTVAQWGVLALSAGILVGAFLVWTLDRLAPRIGSSRSSTEPDLGVIDSPASVVDLGFVETSKLPSESLDRLRTVRSNLLNTRPQESHSVIAVCSPTRGFPSLAVALLLGASLADSYRRTIVVEADVREPSAAKSLSLPGTPGLTEMLTEHLALDEAVMPTPHRMLDVLCVGSPPIDGGEILGTHAMTELIDELRHSYDAVIVCLPAILDRPDAVILAPLCDSVAIIAFDRRTPTSTVSAAADSLRGGHAEVAGTIRIRRTRGRRSFRSSRRLSKRRRSEQQPGQS